MDSTIEKPATRLVDYPSDKHEKNSRKRTSFDKRNANVKCKKEKRTALTTDKYKCEKCGVNFRRKTGPTGLNAHRKTHTPVTKYNCDVCSQNFDSKRDLKRHVEVHSTERAPFVSEVSKRCFAQLSSCSVRLTARHCCKVCGYVSQDEDSYTKHMQKHSQQTPHENTCALEDSRKEPLCEICNKPFTRKDSFKFLMHIPPKTSNQVLYAACKYDSDEASPASSKTTPSEVADWKEDEKRRIGEGTPNLTHVSKKKEIAVVIVTGCPKYICETCNGRFIDAHQETSKETGQPTCKQCGKQITSWKYFKDHAKRHIKSSKCTICGKEFSRNCDVKWHLTEHFCLSCNQQFDDVVERNSHIQNCNPMLVSTEYEDSYECEFCGRKFDNLFSLMSHAKVHVPKRSFHCDVCGIPIRTFPGLESHLRTHKCKVCLLDIRSRAEQTLHRNIDFCCKCRKTFGDVSERWTHTCTFGVAEGKVLEIPENVPTEVKLERPPTPDGLQQALFPA